MKFESQNLFHKNVIKKIIFKIFLILFSLNVRNNQQTEQAAAVIFLIITNIILRLLLLWHYEI